MLTGGWHPRKRVDFCPAITQGAWVAVCEEGLVALPRPPAPGGAPLRRAGRHGRRAGARHQPRLRARGADAPARHDPHRDGGGGAPLLADGGVRRRTPRTLACRPLGRPRRRRACQGPRAPRARRPADRRGHAPRRRLARGRAPPARARAPRAGRDRRPLARRRRAPAPRLRVGLRGEPARPLLPRQKAAARLGGRLARVLLGGRHGPRRAVGAARAARARRRGAARRPPRPTGGPGWLVAVLAASMVPLAAIVLRAEGVAETLFSWRPVARALVAAVPPEVAVVFESPEEYQQVGGLAYYTERRITLLEPPGFVPPTYLAGHAREMFLARAAFERRWRAGERLAFVSDPQRRRDQPTGLVPAPFHVLGRFGDRWVLTSFPAHAAGSSRS